MIDCVVAFANHVEWNRV